MIVGGIALNVLLKLGLVLAIGLVGGRVAREFKLPNVSGYLVAGLFLGPSFTGLITAQDLDALTVISEVASVSYTHLDVYKRQRQTSTIVGAGQDA